jgi:NDP-sugar pyrophosphorylase family protein
MHRGRVRSVDGPVILGAGVSIDAHALVVGPTSLGSETRIGEGSLVCRSVIWSGCQIGDHSFVDASVVGDGIIVPAYGSIEGEVRMNQAKQFSWRAAFASLRD